MQKSKRQKTVLVNEGDIISRIKESISYDDFKIFILLMDRCTLVYSEIQQGTTKRINIEKIYTTSINHIKKKYLNECAIFSSNMMFYYGILHRCEVYTELMNLFQHTIQCTQDISCSSEVKKNIITLADEEIERKNNVEPVCNVHLETNVFDIVSFSDIICVYRQDAYKKTYFQLDRDLEESRIYKQIVDRLRVGCVSYVCDKRIKMLNRIMIMEFKTIDIDITKYNNSQKQNTNICAYYKKIHEKFIADLEAYEHDTRINFELHETRNELQLSLYKIVDMNQRIEGEIDRLNLSSDIQK
jgi:hypothetical protein